MKFIKPNKLPAANIKAELYSILRSNGLKCCLDYRLATPDGQLATLSIIIVVDGYIKAAIVVKSMNGAYAIVNQSTARYRKYESFGIKLFTCAQFRDAKSVASLVYQYIRLDNGHS